ncbi:MAG: hypothetical protein WDW36_008674 [Sanguina aurantia]
MSFSGEIKLDTSFSASDLTLGAATPSDFLSQQQQTQYGLPPGIDGVVVNPTGPAASLAPSDEVAQLCTFFLRTGTCAYGECCKFKHPQDRPPPQLNSRGYPLRPDEQGCVHYLRKGWCAFGPTCKFNHSEYGLMPPSPYGLIKPPVPYLMQPPALQPSFPNIYSMNPGGGVPLYYLPTPVLPGQMGGGMNQGSHGMSLGSFPNPQVMNIPGLQQHATHLMATGHMYRAQEQQQHAYPLGHGGPGQMPRRAPQNAVGELGVSTRNVDQIQLAHAMQSLRMGGGGSGGGGGGNQQQQGQGQGQLSMGMGGGGGGNSQQQQQQSGPGNHSAMSSNWRQRQ